MNRAAAVVPPLLAGRLHHRVVCSPQPPTSSGSKKRARPWEDGSTTTSSNSIFRSGFIFVSDEQEGQEYSLVIPHQLLRIASHAASTGKLVQISHYALLRYKSNGWGEVLLSSSVAKKYNRKQKVSTQRGEDDHLVIEIFVNGLSLTAPNNNGEETAEHETQYSDVLTLEMLASIENQQRNITKGNKKKSNNNEKHAINVTGVVDAISPILVNDPRQEPFAILELYQSPMAEEEEEECTRTAVVVIRGEKALSMHPAIHPGQTITLLDVAHRKWKVPDEFRKRASSNETQNNECNLYDRLSNRVQGRVILVTEATSIKWNDGVSRKSDLTLPSTVDTLTSIRGIVKSVHCHCIDNRNGKENRILHFVTIKLLNSKEKKLARIYLPKYVLSPNTSLGLQPESIIRVVNVHAIPPPTDDEVNKCPCKQQISNEFLCYVACLRSTISIERCAGESSHSNRSANIWFVPSCKPFLLVPDGRISDICGDPFHSKSSAQLSAEERLQQNCLLTYNIPNDALTTLLEYHYHSIAKDSEENVRCICPKRKSEIMNEKNDRQAIRDPYCEFFDHAHSDSYGDWIECGSCSSSFSCFNHFRQATSETMPIAIDMEHIRNACTQHFIQSTGSKCRRDVQSQAADLQAGWTDSFSFKGLQLLQVLNEYLLQSEKDPITWLDTSSDLINIYTCGQIKLSGGNFNTSIYIDDGTCAIPVCETNSAEKYDRSRIKSTPPDDSFAWAHVDSISVSCLCLGPSVSRKGTTIHRAFPHVFLPTSVGKSFDSLPGNGNTFLFLVDNIVFIGSLSIITKSLLEVIGDQSRTLAGPGLEESDKNENDRHVREPHASLLSIGSCLEETETSQSKDDSSSILLGRRIRHSFKFRKVKSAHISGTPLESPLEKCYEGWSITLCHVDNDGCGGVSNMASTLQSIDVTISIPFSKKKMETNHNDCVISLESLNSGLRELFDNSPNATSHGDRISSDQETMCLAWWRASACSDTLPILSGGWDVYVEIPLNGRTFAKLGYQRFRCSLNALKAYHVVESHPIPLSKDNTVFNNSNKVLPGMLNLRLRRQTPSLPSPLIYMNTGGGVSSVSLADLHWDICEAIRKDDSSCMKPSLLRRFHDVKILGISFCRARVECRRCFQALIKKGGKIESIETNSTEEVSLVCPSGCSIHQASVKWECSAIVDDGTGQAKLYAEREAALLLLGAGLDVTTVEKGAWYCDEGVFFQPSLPPSSNLTQSIRIASAKARKLITGKQKRNIAEELSSTYHLLPDIAKAEYLLQQHCRHWSQQHGQRRLDLFCRVKPLSEDLSLNSTEISVAKARVAHVGLEFGMTPAATLPPLKLNLEDACLWCEQRQEDNLTGWNVFDACTRETSTQNSIT